MNSLMKWHIVRRCSVFLLATACISQPYVLVTDEFSGRVRTYAGSELLGTAIYNLEVVTQHLGREVEDVI